MRKILMKNEDIDLAVQRIGLQILERHRIISGEELALVGIHTCGVFLAKRIHTFVSDTLRVRDSSFSGISYGSLDINLYRDDWSLVSQNPVVKTTDIPFDVDNKKIVLVDDVIFTGRTIRAAMDAIMDYGRPQGIQLAALIDRGERELPIQPDYVGMEVKIERRQQVNVVMDEKSAGEVIIEG